MLSAIRLFVLVQPLLMPFDTINFEVRVLSVLQLLRQQYLLNTIDFEVRVGERVKYLCKRLESKGIISCQDFRKISKESFHQYSFVPKKFKGQLRRFEGLFTPNKYTVEKDTAAIKIIEQLLNSSQKRFSSLKKKHSLRPYEQIILASIVEKEAASNYAYDQVANVFLNRLKKRDYLGSCPTVEYALGYHRPFLLFKDLESKSRYNVYKRKGLPPTPIAFFSDGALSGVVNPAFSKNYFFVFDWTTNKLNFSTSYSKHRRNANVARKNFKKKYGRKLMYKKFNDLYYEPLKEVKKTNEK